MKTNSKIIAILIVLSLILSAFSVSAYANNDISIETDYESNQTVELSEKGYDLCNMKIEKLPDELKDKANLSQKSGEKNPVAIDTVDADIMESFTTINEDGSKTLYSSVTPIKYVDKETSEIKFIDNTMKSVENIKDEAAFKNSANDFDLLLPKDISKGIQLKNDIYSIKMTPVTAEQKQTAPKQKNFEFLGQTQDVVEYADIFGAGIHLQYAATNTGCKENIFLEKYNGQNEFPYILEVNGATTDTINENGDIEFTDEITGETAFILPKPWAADSFEDEYDGENLHFTTDCHYTLEKLEDGKYLITVVINEDFLVAESTVYPVIIDPGVNFGTNSGISYTTLTQCCGNHIGDTHVYTGKHCNVTNAESIVYIKFSKSNVSNYKYINPNNITSARVTMKQTWNGGTYSIGSYDSSTSVSLSNATYSTLNNNIGSQTDSVTCGANGNYSWSIKNIFKSWLGYEIAGDGWSQYQIMIKAASTGQAKKQFLCYGNNLWTQIDYNEDLSIPNGTYYIRNADSHAYLNVENNTAIHALGFDGREAQQFKVTRVTSGTYAGSYIMTPMSNTSHRVTLNWPSNDAGKKMWTYPNNDSVNQRWRFINNNDGTYRIMSMSQPNCGIVLNGSIAQVWNYNSNGVRRWVFEKATTGVGGAIDYKSTSRTDIACYQYAMNLNIPEIFINYDYGDSVQTIRDRTLNDVAARGKHIRVISRNGYIHPTREYRVALRVAREDYHFLLQLSNGEWAHKIGDLPSAQLGSVNPTTLLWKWPGSADYNSSTIYFAVQAVSSSFNW